MKKEGDGGQTFTRRAVIIGVLQGGILGILGGRLAWLQIVQGQRYKTLAENNRINIKMLAPPRGMIVDRYNVPLAVNGQNFRAMVVPEQTGDVAVALTRLQRLISLDQRDIQRIMKQMSRSPSFAPLEVKDNLSWEDVAQVEVNLPDLPGVFIDEGDIRVYPLKEAGAHLVGYVAAVNKSEVTKDPLLSIPGFMAGKTGIEKAFEENLRGEAGAAEVEVNVVGREVRELRRQPGRQGDKVALTVDAELQKFAYERLVKEKSASCVVMDVHTGAVYALCSAPGFDPNIFTHGLSAELWEELLADPALPLNNKALAGQYPPGSTFKMITALAALENKVINKSTTAFCPGHYDLGSSRFHCWKKGGHGTVDIVRALAESCDTFFYKLAVDLGIDALSECALKFGLGKNLDFEMKEERPGLIPTKDWKKKNFGETWQPGETVVASIGQGYILTTPLQLAVMTARLVNGGNAVKPWIAVTGQENASPLKEWSSMGFSKEHIDLVLRGMHKVVNGQGGTAYGSRIANEAFQMGGKTGTAQVKRITREERSAGVKNEDLPWNLRHHALFVGYAPTASPRYACCVVVEHGVGGAVAAAPIARDLLLKAQELDLSSRPVTAFMSPDTAASDAPAMPQE